MPRTTSPKHLAKPRGKANYRDRSTGNVTLADVARMARVSPSDLVARLAGQKMSEVFGKPVVVDNKAGATGIIGADYASRAKPDGYTILMGNAQTTAINPSLYKKQ